MFWRFGFHNASAIDSLLDKEDVVLEAILDEDDLLQECKGQNTRLLSYFERVDVLQKLLGYVTGQIETEEKGRFNEIWSIVETCIGEQNQLLVPFWETVLDRSPDDMKTQMIMASHFAKVNSVFMTKKPVEMLAFIQSQPNIVERLIRHIETPSFVDLIGRIIQLDEVIPNSNVLEWLSSENLMGRLIELLSPYHTPSVHTVVADLVKNIISMATPSPGAVLTEGLQNGPASNRFARELAGRENMKKLADYMLNDFSSDSCNTPPEHDSQDEGTLLSPTFESSTSSVVQSIAVIIELIRKNNSDYFEPYLFHALRNRLIHAQQQSHLAGEDLRASLEQVLQEMVHRMGVVHLGPMLEVLSSRLHEFQKYLKSPRSLQGPISTTIGRMTPFTLERYRIVELYAELLHCSNMSLLNRSALFSRVYDSEGRLQGGLAGLEELAQVIALNSGNDRESDEMDESPDEPTPSLAFPVRHPSGDSPSLDSDDDMTGSDDEPGSSDDEAMEEIAMYDEPLSPIPFAQPLPSSSTMAVASSPEALSLSSSPQTDSKASLNVPNPGSSPESDGPGMSGRSSGRGSRRSSRSRRRHTMEQSTETLLPVGEQLKRRWLDQNILGTMIDMFFEFPWNNFLHSTVYDVVHQVMTGGSEGGYNRELIISLFRDAKILHRIIEGQALNDLESAKPKGVRLGYMGHLMLISEDVITAMARFPPDLRLIIIQYAPEPEWDNYVTGRYNETKQEENRRLGGGKPVVNSAAARNMAQWKVDENELAGETDVKGVDDGQPKGEFRRAASVGPSGVTQTADFGPAPVDEDEDEDEDEDNISSTRAPHFARYLAQEMGNSDQFGSSSDEDDEDEGWLTQSTFGLNPAPVATRPFSEPRRPLSSNGFGDAFDPNSTPSTRTAMTEDPFSSQDDDDGFGPFSDTAAASGDGFTFSSSFSDEDSSFESFGDFGDFQSAETETLDEGESTTPTTTTGSWTFAPGHEFGVGLEEVSNHEQGKGKDKAKEKGTGIGTEGSSSSTATLSSLSSTTTAKDTSN
ncbi:Extragenic suppressor of kinetochore protein 1 [Psilocybe cubensis]|uniref:Extragenic suppressor of kinetochore protein 1 n=1 Tax=Psilocybe cubensis TaxID=181762 RepID=A0ACB8H9Y7_PSICU|nr:Extragenic suppressor of kinetochore protein 1 [Psilocybe cubensis]KAH9484467.1 Extragenic suppressor of kinetochore protein 1 [Psilocybe cubensis]